MQQGLSVLSAPRDGPHEGVPGFLCGPQPLPQLQCTSLGLLLQTADTTICSCTVSVAVVGH